MAEVIERRLIAVDGVVQGVGFRPHVYALATSRRLVGLVRNEPDGVFIDVQGDTAALDDFIAALVSNPPPLATIASVQTTISTARQCSGFVIAETAEDWIGSLPSIESDRQKKTQKLTLAPPDVATCNACLAELFDPADRRFQYPFINCTQCGPRFTILRALPYDRPSTTMAEFSMCDACRREYKNPADRRFHAQPIACPDCGPSLWVHHTDTSTSEGVSEDPLASTLSALIAGHIVAIKGLGGYHIACDATNKSAVDRLRARKHREAKPLAVMAEEADIARVCTVSNDERALLRSRESPMVLLAKRSDRAEWMEAMESIAPRTAYLGAMLPYTPLHHLLLRAVRRPLVMTSGNLSEEPIAFEDEDAITRLSPVVDLILGHDRPIATRCDDSVMRVVDSTAVFHRRSRGFAPRPVSLPVALPSHTLAVGGHLKNTFCLARERLAFMSHHIGDLENLAAYRSLEEGIAAYSALTGVAPVVVAHDLHPGYMSTQFARGLDGIEVIGVQHHHAHVASCMADNGVSEPVIGVAFDGAGLGDDGTIWGGEFLVVGSNGYRRAGHLACVSQPGGEAAVRRPLRMAVSHLLSALEGDTEAVSNAFTGRASQKEINLVTQMLGRNVNSPLTSSVGRLFDAVASITGVRDDALFEGQAAMELESIADPTTSRRYSFDISETAEGLIVQTGSVIRSIVSDLSKGILPGEVSGAFHQSLAAMITGVCGIIREQIGETRVALSGGVFQNVLLGRLAAASLKAAGFVVLQHRVVPCNDGGLSLGQAYTVALGSKEA